MKCLNGVNKMSIFKIKNIHHYFNYFIKSFYQITDGIFENSSFGMTICAERNAIGSAITDGEKKIKAVAIYSPNQTECAPCGACRQVLYEFQGDNEIEVITEEFGNLQVNKLSYFLPCGFKI